MPNLCLTIAILANLQELLQHGARASCALSELRVRELRFVRAASERGAARAARARRARTDSLLLGYVTRASRERRASVARRARIEYGARAQRAFSVRRVRELRLARPASERAARAVRAHSPGARGEARARAALPLIHIPQPTRPY